ncbi:MAG: hypothetical protein ACYDG5_07595, partial [Dehalococcoidales bacterium]
TMSGSTSNIILGSNYLSGDGGDEGIFVDASGNVGVGTGSPGSYKLYVNGDSYFGGNITLVGGSSITSTGTSTFSTSVTTPLLIGGSAIDSKITYQSTTGAGTLTAIAHQFVGGTNGGTVIATMLNNGNVGIGTTAPKDKFHVSSGLIVLDNNQQLVSRNLLDNGNVQLIGTTGASNLITVGGANVGGGISFNDGNGVKMYYANGELRLGDATPPTNALEVVGIGTFTNNVGIATTVTPTEALYVGDGTNSRYVAIDGAIASDVGVKINKAGSEEWKIYQPANSNDLRFNDVDGGAADMVTFQSGGKVGIGVTSPDSLIELEGAAISIHIDSSSSAVMNIDRGANTNDGLLSFRTANTAKADIGLDGNSTDFFHIGNDGLATKWMTFDTTQGYVGIGTTDPTFQLHVAGTTGIGVKSAGVDGTFTDILSSVYSGNSNEQNAIQASVSSVAESSGFNFLVSDGGGLATQKQAYRMSRDSHRFYIGGTEKVTINNQGNVGIGTTAPGFLLEMNQSNVGSVTDFRLINPDNTNSASGSRGIISVGGASAGDPRLL